MPDPTKWRRHPDNRFPDPAPAGAPPRPSLTAMERRHARSGSPFEETIGFSRAVRVGDAIAVSGTAPVWPDGHVDPDPTVQARRCWEIALRALEELGGRVQDVVRTRQYVVRADLADAVGAVHGEVFGDARPASTMIVVAGLLDPRWLVEVEVDAVVSG
jgi:enamine deaminase RidA (YjgF/YER057c/UK114 family)